MFAICDTSPLIFLAKTGKLPTLFQLYTTVCVPPAVRSEIFINPTEAEAKLYECIEGGKIQQRHPVKRTVQQVPERFGAGEREAIALAMDTPDALLVIDDAQARQFARSNSVSLTGTIGVLIEAYHRNILPPTPHDIDQLIEAGLWINEAFYQRIIETIEDLCTGHS